MIAWAVESFVASTLLMLVVLVLRGPVRRGFGPGLAYTLWTLPVLRMVLPPLPAEWHARAAAPIARASEVVTLYVVEPLTQAPGIDPAAADAAPFPWLACGLALWASGALLFLGYHLVAHGRFCARLRRDSRVTHTVAGGRVQVIETDAATGPLAFGIWRKYVAFPRDFHARYDAQERDLALAHELGHHLRGDLIANWIALVVLALHWCNPIAWRAFRAFRADQEMACDALVLAGRAPALRHAYGRAIVKSAHGGAVSAACHLHTVNDIKGRLRMLGKDRKTSRRRFAAGVVGMGGLTLAALAGTASGTQAAERLRIHLEDKLGVDLASVDTTPPVPPVPAAPPAVAAPSAPAHSAVPPVPPLPPVAAVSPAGTVAPQPPVPPVPPATRSVHSRQVSTIVDKDGKRAVHMVEHTGPAPAWVERARRDAELDRDRADRARAAAQRELANIPEVRDAKCGLEADRSQHVVVRTVEGGRTKMIICTDRIEAQARRAELASHAVAMRSAIVSLQAARSSILAERALSADQRREALEGIDHAMRELHDDRRQDD